MKISTIGVAAFAAAASAVRTKSRDFDIEIDDATGAVVRISDARASGMNWVSAPANAPWQPLGSRWGLGFADLGEDSLHRHFWSDPKISNREGSVKATYALESLQIEVTRSFKDQGRSFHESYKFTNRGLEPLAIRGGRGALSFGIYTPFNDHYTNTTDALNGRAHAHVWANGGSTAWVKMDQMGGHHRNLGLVLTEGSLSGYSIESRDEVTLSNTRGVFLLNPLVPTLQPGQSSTISWALFWHNDWDDFFNKCAELSDQFISFQADHYTTFQGETLQINMTGAVSADTRVNGSPVKCDKGLCTYNYSNRRNGQQALTVESNGRNSTVYVNTVPPIDDLITSRVHFIVDRQQVPDESQNDPTRGAYRVYDNQVKAIATWDTSTDRNAGRERVGMGILMARYLKRHPDDKKVRASLERYYDFVSLRLQDSNGYVYDRPIGTGTSRHRLYNWPWVMQFHLTVAALNLNFTGPVSEKTPLERFLLTMENFYDEGGAELYAIGLPILEGLRYLEAIGETKSYERALDLFTRHGNYIVDRGTDYPPFEVNFEQSIVAPAAIMTVELYRATGNQTFLDAAKLQIRTLDRFVGHQPDHRLHEVAIRHWDGYWFGKDRHWGDTFPHHWSTLNAVALHHYGAAINDTSFGQRADSVNRANLALFSPDGTAGCAWVYPVAVNGKPAHHRDHYANDQDWVLAHILQIEEDKEATESISKIESQLVR
ncbi:hypothetical protein HJFPF1_10628 [Paramyrothecium foliicola]|nr:hypothetical protein HJFPF1_10628 [Paramyrothecium foliicola]